MKAECRRPNGPETAATEDIVLVTLDDCNEELGIHKAYLLGRQRRGSDAPPFQVMEVFDQARRSTEYTVPDKFAGTITHVAPDNASFDLVNLTGGMFPDIVVRLWFSGGSYVPFYVAVVLQQKNQLTIALRVRGGSGVFDVDPYKDLDADGQQELLIPQEIYVPGLAHAYCPTWVSCYQWTGGQFVLANKLFYKTDSRVAANLLKKYKDAVSSRDYFEEYEYYLGLVQYYRGDLAQASRFLHRVVERAANHDYVAAATTVLKEMDTNAP